ncbi:hypothetical protein [Deinococcus navajonensis]|uniref:HTH cro/C1-type domain-containing protein n=1 Tax=Deinococcus navajonensis TaxID=309884 RepID=A0ABV8XLH6_9DEIO
MSLDLLARAGALLRTVRQREGASLEELADSLMAFRSQVTGLPPKPGQADPASGLDPAGMARQVALAWPELGLYDLGSGEPLLAGGCQTVPDDIGSAHDDLAALALDLQSALALAPLSEERAVDTLRRSMHSHRVDQVLHLLRHLRALDSTTGSQ